MLLIDVLRQKGSAVYFISPDSTLDDVVQHLIEHNCGSLVVCEPSSDGGSRMVGIITERDILRHCAAHRGSLESILVREAMTRDVITATPTDEISGVMGQMTNHRIRHLPVLDGNSLVGLISIGDVVKFQHRQFQLENHYLKSYIEQGA